MQVRSGTGSNCSLPSAYGHKRYRRVSAILLPGSGNVIGLDHTAGSVNDPVLARIAAQYVIRLSRNISGSSVVSRMTLTCIRVQEDRPCFSVWLRCRKWTVRNDRDIYHPPLRSANSVCKERHRRPSLDFRCLAIGVRTTRLIVTGECCRHGNKSDRAHECLLC